MQRQPTARRLLMSSPPFRPRLQVEQRGMAMQPVSPDLVTRAWRGMLTTPERDSRAVGITIPWNPGAQPLMYPQQDLLQQLLIQQAQFQQAQQLQNQEVLQCLRQLVLQSSGSEAMQGSEILQNIAAAQQLPAPQPLALGMPHALPQPAAQPISSARPAKRRQFPQLKSLRDLQQFWQFWHNGDELSGISAVKEVTGAEKHQLRRRISEWSRAVEAIEARAASTDPASPASMATVNELELKRQESSESVRALVFRLGKEHADEKKQREALAREARDEPSSST
ncbi:g8950 [Coccomyxa viridis]|uniref:G8950 protein n=1 Tax=Coccomyxa viridis TaxID=1274662 RepID=A0ABP1G2W3_9CHLO